jgi:hypothetical protein
MVSECFDRYDFDYIGLESFDFCGPQSRAKISHARWTSFSHINWYKKCRAFHKDIKKSPGILAKGKTPPTRFVPAYMIGSPLTTSKRCPFRPGATATSLRR